MSTLRLCATESHKKKASYPIPKKGTRTKSHVSPLLSAFTPTPQLVVLGFYGFALFHAIFSYIYFACNSFPFIFTWEMYKVLVNFYSLSPAHLSGICEGIALGIPALLYHLFMLDASVFFFLSSNFTGIFGFCRGFGPGRFDSQTALALAVRFQLIQRRFPNFPRRAGAEGEITISFMDQLVLHVDLQRITAWA